MLKVVDKSTRRKGLHFERRIHWLLKFVPREHLVGLSQITLLDHPVGKWAKERLKNARAAYHQAYGQSPAYIEMYADRIFGNTSSPVFFFIPLAATRMMAWSLFHEIGHHHNKSLHGITAKKEEGSAEAYAEQLYEKFEEYYDAFHRRVFRWPFYEVYFFLLRRTEPYKSKFRVCKAALKQKPDEVSTLVDLAHMHYHFLRFRKSKRLYQKALQFRPEDGDLYYELACIEWWQRNWRQSALLFELAIKHKTKKKDVTPVVGKGSGTSS